MNRRGKLTVITEANNKLEQSYLKSKGFLKEDVDVDKFKEYIENLSKNYKFPYHMVNDNDFGKLYEKLNNLPLDKLFENDSQGGLLVANMGGRAGFKVAGYSKEKALLKRIQDDMIKNYSKFTSGEHSELMSKGRAGKIEQKWTGMQDFIKQVQEIAKSFGEDIQMVGEITKDRIQNYVTQNGMGGKKLFIGAEGNIMYLVDDNKDDNTKTDFLKKLFEKYPQNAEVFGGKALRPYKNYNLTGKDNVGISVQAFNTSDVDKEAKNVGSKGTSAISKVNIKEVKRKDDKGKDITIFYFPEAYIS